MKSTRKWWLLAILLFGLAQATSVEGLELGELVVHSAPGEPLRASIPIGLAEGMPLASLQVSLATDEQYQQRGLSHPTQFSELRFALLERGKRRARIQIFGDTPWRGEPLDLLLHLRYSAQEKLLAYSIQPITTVETAEYITAGRNETLDSVAIRLADRHNRSYLHMMYALYQANPEAFYRNNMNNLRGGSRLRLPSSEELYRFGDTEAFSAIREHQSRWQNAPRGPEPLAEPAPDRIDLERDHAQLLADLQQVSAEESRFSAQNQALREQLTQLESRVSQISTELFSEAVQSETLAPQAKEPGPADKPLVEEPKSPASLPSWPFLLLLGVVLISGILLNQRLRQRTRGAF